MAREDLLFKRLRSLKKNNLKTLLVSGLRVAEEELKRSTKEDLVQRCSKELRAAAGSSTLNLRRGDHDFPYKQILIDVADKMTEGVTPLNWTPYKLDDKHSELEIEAEIIRLFEQRTRKWWRRLSPNKKAEFAEGLQSALRGQNVGKVDLTDGLKAFLTQQAIENAIQSGIMSGLANVAAPGLPGLLGISIISQAGWMILLQTVGWMGGLKIALFGIGGFGAFGGAVTFLGGAAIGGVLGLPTAVAMLDGPAYRKTIPTVIMLIARARAGSLQK